MEEFGSDTHSHVRRVKELFSLGECHRFQQVSIKKLGIFFSGFFRESFVCSRFTRHSCFKFVNRCSRFNWGRRYCCRYHFHRLRSFYHRCRCGCNRGFLHHFYFRVYFRTSSMSYENRVKSASERIVYCVICHRILLVSYIGFGLIAKNRHLCKCPLLVIIAHFQALTKCKLNSEHLISPQIFPVPKATHFLHPPELRSTR